MQATPFQTDYARKAGGLRDYQDRRMRSGVCAECLVLRRFHVDSGCKFRRMKDREWADYCGVDFASVEEEVFLRKVEETKPGSLAGQFYFRLECGHQEHRLLDRMHPQMPQTLRCLECAKSSQTAVAGSKTLEEVEDMSLEKIQFPPNVAQQVALKFPEGKMVEGRFGDQVYFTLADPPESCMYVDMGVAEMVNRLQLRRGEPVVICKRSSGKKGAIPQWEVYRPGQEAARPAPRVDATGIEESDIEAEVRARKVAELRATIERLEAGANVSASAPVTQDRLATPATVAANGNGNKPQNGNGSNGNGTNGHRPYEAAGIPPPPTKIPMNIAFTEIIAWMKAGLEANHLQWSDAAQQDLLSTALIGGMREGWISIWERGAK